MYLRDIDIKEKLRDMSIVCDNPQVPFQDEDQIQPCSIDLRLSNVFWEPQHKRKSIDLRKDKLLRLEPERYWKQRELKAGGHLTLKPHSLLLARTYEEFTVPSDCAGKIEGRSSFARLGLAVHCSGDFINPGWRGHMPLQLVNHGPLAIRIFPYLPVCQLKLVKLSGIPAQPYAGKYMHDTGGPSFWWKDKLIIELQQALRKVDVALDIQDRVLEKAGPLPAAAIRRFEDLVERVGAEVRGNSDLLLEAFVEHEKRRKRRSIAVRWLSGIPFPVLASLTGRRLLDYLAESKSWGCPGWILTALSLAALVSLYYAVCGDWPSYVTSLPRKEK